MDNQIYQSPKADLDQGIERQIPLPSPFTVAVFLLLASLAMGLILAAIEFLMESPLPGTNAITTVVPALLVGSYYGGKRGELFSPAFRHKVIGLWLLASIILGFGILILLAPEIFDSGTFASVTGNNMALFLAIMAVALLFAYALSYFIFRSGEKVGIKQWQKKYGEQTL